MTAWISRGGCEAIHTLDLPAANRTADRAVIEAADQQQRVLITKDADFVDAHVLFGRPARLLLVSTGNISNRDLESLLMTTFPEIIRCFEAYSFVELGRSGTINRG